MYSPVLSFCLASSRLVLPLPPLTSPHLVLPLLTSLHLIAHLSTRSALRPLPHFVTVWLPLRVFSSALSSPRRRNLASPRLASPHLSSRLVSLCLVSSPLGLPYLASSRLTSSRLATTRLDSTWFSHLLFPCLCFSRQSSYAGATVPCSPLSFLTTEIYR